LTTMQFHPESILTQNGVDIIKEELLRLFLWNLKKLLH
jgi:anthranilate/para-aminobenzoate synthase component II